MAMLCSHDVAKLLHRRNFETFWGFTLGCTGRRIGCYFKFYTRPKFILRRQLRSESGRVLFEWIRYAANCYISSHLSSNIVTKFDSFNNGARDEAQNGVTGKSNVIGND